MIEIRLSCEFKRWFKGLHDLRARARIDLRIERLEDGYFGDVKFFGGIGELRIDYGPGYRLYFARRGSEIIVLLCGGDKSSQSRDIRKALQMAKEL